MPEAIIRVLIHFDNIHKVIPDDAEIAFAELSFFIFNEHKQPNGNNPNGNKTMLGGTRRIHRIKKEWESSSVSWQEPWETEGGDFSDTVLASFTNTQKEVWENYEVTDLIKQFVEDPSINFGFLLSFDENNHDIVFGAVAHASEYTDITKRPKLTIYYSPKK